MTTTRFYSMQVFWTAVLVLVITVGYHEIFRHPTTEGPYLFSTALTYPIIVLLTLEIPLLQLGNEKDPWKFFVTQFFGASIGCMLFFLGYFHLTDPWKIQAAMATGILMLLLTFLVPRAFQLIEAQERAAKEHTPQWVLAIFYGAVPVAYGIGLTLYAIGVFSASLLGIAVLFGFFFQVSIPWSLWLHSAKSY